MEARLRIVALPACALAIAAACAAAHAGVIYKSEERDGRVTFSDIPIEGAVVLQRIESSDGGKPAVGNDASSDRRYLALADGFDEAVRQANARVDLAEHALALVRRSILGDDDPLGLRRTRLTEADSRLIDFYKRDLAEARRNLMRVLQQRNALAPRPLA